MTAEGPKDAIDAILEQWATQRPDLEPSPMAVVARIHRVAAILESGLRPPFASEGLGNGDFDVLAALRRVGPPFRLSASELSAAMVVTSGAVTKRVDRMEAAGLVSRTVSANDARGREIELTERGLEVVDRVAEVHWRNEDRLLGSLDAAERDQLAWLLRKLLIDLDPKRQD